MYSASDLRKGLKIEIEGEPWLVAEFDFSKPGKGQALYRCKLKNMITGNTMDKTYRSVEKIGKANLEEREVFYSYPDGDFFVFSDAETYEEYNLGRKTIGDMVNFLIENSSCKILFFNDQPIDVTLPIFVEKAITDTEPGARGDTATNVNKPAKIDNGYQLDVPIFLNEGDIIKIDTRTGAYVERVKKA